MAIPDTEGLMLPLLRLLGDEQTRVWKDTSEELADYLGLSEDERNERLKGRKYPIIGNNFKWACDHLTKAGLIERPGPNRIRISEQGLSVLNSGVDRIDSAFIARMPSLRASTEVPSQSSGPSVATQGGERSTPTAPTAVLSPDEMLEGGYRRLRQELADELLTRVKQAPPAFFEQLVVDLLVKMGYGGSQNDAAQAVGRSGDGGIDGIIKEDRLGLDFVYIQAKRWDQPVSRPDVQGFAGSLDGRRARKGVFITTSRFTREAVEFVSSIEKRIVLIDGEQLAQLMLDFGVGVTEVASYRVQRIDLDYFGDG
jgi:restriction system protein